MGLSLENVVTKEEFLTLDCKHDEAYTRSCYTGGEFKGAVTYCRECEEGYTTPKQIELPQEQLPDAHQP